MHLGRAGGIDCILGELEVIVNKWVGWGIRLHLGRAGGGGMNGGLIQNPLLEKWKMSKDVVLCCRQEGALYLLRASPASGGC